MILKSTDLRIGNWLHNSFLNAPVKVNPQMIDMFYKQEHEAGWDTEIALKPIELTPELLKKAGYKYDKKESEYSNEATTRAPEPFGDRLTIYEEDGVFSFLVVSHHYNGFGVEIKYLHQLQNLYFALTGTELELHL